MLHQNWFQDKRFEMFEEYAESQSFYDVETKNIYVVSEEYGQKGSTIIQEITPDSFEYVANYARYKKFKGIEEEYTVTFIAEIESTVKASSPEEAKKIASKQIGEYKDNTFGYAYLSEVKNITDKNGNEMQ